jgi:AhpD family alkylhydroperoxidase
MSNHYHDPSDLGLMKQMKELAPVEFKAWVELDKISKREDGAIPRKYRELMCLALAHATQCPYCLEVHAKAAKAAGATRQEVVESTFLAAAMMAGGAAAHGTLALKLYDQAT